MRGVRQKLLFAFGGLLVILLLVGALSLVLLTRYSGTIERIFRENYDSVVYGQNMKEAIEEMNDLAQFALWQDLGATQKTIDQLIVQFEENLRKEAGNITLAGERELVEHLAALWQEYSSSIARVLREGGTETERRALYRERLVPLSQQVKSTAQRVIAINLENIVSIDGQVRQSAVRSQWTMYALLAAGAGLAILLFGTISRSILRPLGLLTRSAREIEAGNLDLVVSVPSRDEVGQLAAAFNSMASRLREFRRSDRARLVRTQRTTQLAINSLPDAVAILGPDGRVELANETARKLFRLHPDTDVASLPFKGLAELYQRASREARSFRSENYETAIQVFNGQERFFLPQAMPILDEDGQLMGVTLLLVDVTSLRRLDEMKSGLLSVVSHELKTPLTSIRMAMHLLLEERLGALTEKQVELVVAAREDSERLYKIIENLLDMTRIESGRALMELKPLDVESLVSQAADAARASFRDQGVLLEVDVPAGMPSVLADPVRIGLVFSNLLSNALRHTPSGGEVQISAQSDDDSVRFTVKDTGAGIAPEHLPHVFERFYRVPKPNASPGAGLGLAIAKDIVEAHGGRIWAESQVGAGSVLSFTFPHQEAKRRGMKPSTSDAPEKPK